ncbi:hypothetical protein MSAN_01939300 [Mycena sanguinolenta]|uniref:NADH dehydrogenase [ubiquinone] 1 alpha subcomplex subunit n=1 Tax=Mycena sanguinolenta TaxID=230812 RepID=A0A8H6XQB4_9AGAR|nr:hypothetical protein MSAN_01939300 [Mycena sanguinolenta]
MSSILRRLIQRLRSPTYYIGRDLQGNRYYESPSLVNDPRPRRSVKYSGSQDMWKYVGGSKRLPVQWSSWLTHTRSEPPTMEELQADLIRQERVRRNVMLLNARDQAEDRLKLASHAQPALPGVASHADLEAPPPDPAVASPPPTPKPKPLPTMPSSTKDAEPEAWMPRAAARGTRSTPPPPSHADLETPPPDVSPTMPSNDELKTWTPHAATQGNRPTTVPSSHADLETPPPDPAVASPVMHSSTEPETWTPRTASRA